MSHIVKFFIGCVCFILVSCDGADFPDILELHSQKDIIPVLKNFKSVNNLSENSDQEYTPLSLLWFSDIHGNMVNLSRISSFYGEYKDYIDDVLHTGDCQIAQFGDDFSFWANNGGSCYLNIMGNHDVCSYHQYELDIISQKQCFDKFFKPHIGRWGVNYEENKTYWYKDYPLAKSKESPGGIRLIGLDLFHWKETPRYNNDKEKTVDLYPDGTPVDQGEQEMWFVDVLQDAINNGLAVIVAIHNPTPNLSVIECSFNVIDRWEDSGLRDDMIDDVQSFIDKGGEFITWLCGHVHQDWMGNIISYPSQTLLTIGTSNYTTPYKFDNMEGGTKSMDRFNIFNVEPQKKYIRMFRVGLEYDNHGRHIGSVVYDYKNKVLISND